MDDTYPQWNLEEFYDSYQSSNIIKDIESIKTSVLNFNKSYKGLLKKLGSKKLEKSIQEFEILEEKIGRIRSYIYLIYCTNQLNSEIVAFYQKISELLTNINSHLIFYCLELNLLDEKTVSLLKKSKYIVWLRNLRKFKKYQKKEEIEKILLDKSMTSSSSCRKIVDNISISLSLKQKQIKNNKTNTSNRK